ncbi:cutinase family protein [Rhodococcus sp. NPDC058521]|uniref:cutinase family protein n=1 Tax=Rhodococcus sp. NPDC058521 TaxID=3346536 RepID=UPI00365B1BD7
MLFSRTNFARAARGVVAVGAVVLTLPGLAHAQAPDTGSASGSADSGSVSGSSETGAVHPDNYGAGCPDVMVVAISGATDSEVDNPPLDESDRKAWSNWVGNVTVPTGERFADDPGTVGWAYVPYPSTYGVGFLEPVPTYQNSVAAGVASMNKILDDKKNQCGDATDFVLLGYSVGGEVTERVAREIGGRDSSAKVTADDILGVALVGDPYRPAGTPSMGEPGPSGGGFMSSEPADYGKLADKISYACRPYDIACDAPEEIAVVELALGVLGQMHFTLVDPGQTVADFRNVVSDMATRAIVHIVAHDDWFGSDETFLDVLRKVADKTYDPDGPDVDTQYTPEQKAAMLDWAMGPGSDIVKEKLKAEGPGFLEDNRGIFELVTKPYIFLGFIQHMAYWNINPNDPWYWESEKIVDWIVSLVEQEDVQLPTA